VNIPVDELRSRLTELPAGGKIAAYCQVGQRGYLATRILNQSGFDAVNVGGGYKTWLLHQPPA
jgi:rhodanese-related sulfurtransferase